MTWEVLITKKTSAKRSFKFKMYIDLTWSR